MDQFPEETLDRLAKQVVGGEVVFFIGMGFSLASEGNNTSRLLGRLYARYLGITEVLGTDNQRVHEQLNTLTATFNLEDLSDDPDDEKAKANLEKVCDSYFRFNDWICSAFGELVEMLEKKHLRKRSKIWKRIHVLESDWLDRLTADPVPLDPINFEILRTVEPEERRGKALFLETMGFSNSAIWTGRPYAASHEKFADSYGDRLHPRHRVLASLAREGLTPILLTTNYDLLLEGAYRASGFLPTAGRTEAPEDGLEVLEVLEVTDRQFSVLASPEQFYEDEGGYQSALIVKIHGCVQSYREEKIERNRRQRSDEIDTWGEYLRSVVYTYREIQNWREDSWSRDFLRTLLRTRTMVFCGYSGIDPVLHDTIRTVYEEMAAVRPPRSDQPKRRPRAYYFDVQGKRDFHSLEILRAASGAAGRKLPRLSRQTNLLEFHIDGVFPDLDEQMRWLLHRSSRELQRRALEGELVGVAHQIFREELAKEEYDQIRRAFSELCEDELRTAKSWNGGPEDRSSLDRITSWTACFHTPMRRDFLLRDLFLRTQSVERFRSEPAGLDWYFPMSEHPGWVAFMVVAEIAVRRMIAYQGDWTWYEDTPWVRAVGRAHAAVLFSTPGDPLPRGITVRRAFDEFQDDSRDLPRSVVSSVRWKLTDEMPWYRGSDDDARLPPDDPTPRAALLWEWAREAEGDLETLDPTLQALGLNRYAPVRLPG